METVKVASGQTSLYDISWQVSEKDYRKGEGISYSTISRFNREGFDGLHKLFEPIEGAHLVFGSMVDTILTGTKQEFEDNYVIAEFPKVADSQLGVIKYLFNNHAEQCSTLTTIPDSKIIEATEILKFQTNWKPETRAKVIKENGAEYYNLLHISRGKQLVGTQEYEDANICVDALKTSYFTKFYFEKNNPFDTSIERFFQLKFRGTYEGVPLRCMADEIVVNHKTKTVTPVDLKTSYKKEWLFYESFMQWGYWIQAQLYWYIIRQNMDKHPLYKDYVLEDYKFIVVY